MTQLASIIALISLTKTRSFVGLYITEIAKEKVIERDSCQWQSLSMLLLLGQTILFVLGLTVDVCLSNSTCTLIRRRLLHIWYGYAAIYNGVRIIRTSIRKCWAHMARSSVGKGKTLSHTDARKWTAESTEPLQDAANIHAQSCIPAQDRR